MHTLPERFAFLVLVTSSTPPSIIVTFAIFGLAEEYFHEFFEATLSGSSENSAPRLPIPLVPVCLCLMM